MEPCQQEARITRIEAAVEAIGGQVATLVTSVNELKVKLEPVLKQVEEHGHDLYGHDGEEGVISKTNRAVKVIDQLDEALRGTPEKPGLIAVVDKLADKVGDLTDERKWILRLLIGALALFALGGLYTLFASHGVAWN